MSQSDTNRDWLELSLSQQAIWLEAKLNRESVLQLGGWARIEGNIEESIARQAVALIMARHDALRLRADDEKPRQWLDKSIEPPLSVVGLPVKDDPDSAFRHHIEEVFAAPMPFGDHPLFCIELIKVNDQLNYMLWRFHHLIADAVSTTTTMRHWTEAYLSLISDEPPALAPRSSYLSLIVADREYLFSRDYEQDLAYWLQRFKTLPSALVSQNRGPGSGQDTIFYADWKLSGALWSGLNRYAGQLKISPSRVLLAVFTLMLAGRYDQADLVTGIALHRRERATRQSLGMFSGVLAVRFGFSRVSSVEQAILDYSAQVDLDLRHQRMPVDNLARALGLFRLGRSRLFEVVMSYLPADRIQNDSLSIQLPVTSGVVPLKEASPISLHITELDEERGMLIRVSVNPAVFISAEALSLLADFQRSLEVAVSGEAGLVENLFSMNFEDHAIVENKANSGNDREEWII